MKRLLLTIGCLSACAGPMGRGNVPDTRVELTRSGIRLRLTPEAPLPESARDALADLMSEHVTDMESLLWASLMFNYEEVQRLASAIAERPSLSRPAPGVEAELKPHFPKYFFSLQDELEQASKDLAASAAARNDKGIADALGRVTKTCVACHSVYLHRTW